MEQLIGMQFKDVVIALPDCDVKLGAKDGSGFFWVGYARELRDEMPRINAMARGIWERFVSRSKRHLDGAHDPAYIEYIRAELTAYYTDKTHHADTGGEHYEEYVAKWREGIKRKADETVHEITRYHDFVPLPERTVQDCFWSNAEEHTLIIVLTGYEQGRAWTKGEYYEQTGKKEEASRD